MSNAAEIVAIVFGLALTSAASVRQFIVKGIFILEISVMLPIFISVFMAELGDKTQVATVCFMAGGGRGKSEVFWASSLALLLSTFLAVVFGAAITLLVPLGYLKAGAGAIFLIMGGLFIRQALKKPEGGEI